MESKLQVIFGEDKLQVDGRQLHMFLEVETPYKKWFDRMSEYGFEENKDFITVDKIVRRADGAEMPQKQYDHLLTLDMAKELAMLQRTNKGKEARQYFLQVERDWNSPEKVMARALSIAQKTLSETKVKLADATKTIEAQKPKVLFADAVSASKNSILIGELAKLLKQNGVDMGTKRLFAWLRNNSYLMKSGSSKNMPTQRAMEQKLFEIKEGSYVNSNGVNITTKTTKVTGKGQLFFVNKFLNSKGV